MSASILSGPDLLGSDSPNNSHAAVLDAQKAHVASKGRVSPSMINAQKSTNVALNQVEACINSLLFSFGETSILGREREIESSRIIEQAQSLILSSRNPLPKNVEEAQAAVSTHPFMAFLEAAYGYAKAAVKSLVGMIFTYIRQLLPFIFEESKKSEFEELKFILQSLRHQHYISPRAEAGIQKAFQRENFDELEHSATLLIGDLVQDPIDSTRIIDLLRNKHFLEAFRYLHAIALLHDLNKCSQEWQGLLTAKEVKEFASSIASLRKTGSLDPLSDLLIQSTSRLNTQKWLEKEFEHISFKDNPQVATLKENALEHLRKKDELAFAEVVLKIFALADRTKRSPLENVYLDELSAHFKNCDSSQQLFKKISLHYGHSNFLTMYVTKAVHLQALLVRKMNLSSQADIQKLEALANSCLSLYGHYGSLLESEERSSLSPTQFTALYGKTVSIWRQINEAFLAQIPQNQLNNEKSHAVCSCLYGRAVQQKMSSLKWKGLPEKVQGLRAIEEVPHDAAKSKAKSVLFLTCTYGGGHISATDALINYTKQHNAKSDYRYHIRSLNVPLDVLLPLDPIFNTLGKIWNFMNMDYIYNKFMSWDRCDLIAHLRKLGGGKASEESKEQKKMLIRQAILRENPDVVVMTYTFNAEPILEVCKELGIPIAAISTDTDISGLEGLTIPKHFKLTTFSEHRKTMETMTLGTDFVKKHLEVTGPPIRAEFLKPYSAEDIQKIRQARGIEAGEEVVLFVSGFLGVPSKVPEVLASWKQPEKRVRLIVVTGKNSAFKEYLEEAVLPHIANKARMKIDVQGHTSAKEMADLMRVAHVVIGKPGGATITEVLHTGARYLGDQTGYRLDWEKRNNDVAIDLGVADKVEDLLDLIPKLSAELKKPKIQAQLFPSDAPFSEKYTNLIERMISDAESDEPFMAQRKKWEPAQELTSDLLESQIQNAQRGQAILV